VGSDSGEENASTIELERIAECALASLLGPYSSPSPGLKLSRELTNKNGRRALLKRQNPIPTSFFAQAMWLRTGHSSAIRRTTRMSLKLGGYAYAYI
jgi:hypothetical protein